MTYKFIDNVTMADVAFEAKNKDLNKLFEDCGLATFDTMINLKKVKSKIKKEIKLQAENIEELLFKFLDELIFLKDSESLVFNKFKVKIEEDKIFKLNCVANGEEVNIRRHDTKVDVKAPTMHKFKVEKKNNSWSAFVILDV
ncbi:MAG: archease [Candidatus Nanoarchaeia archaeon]|jgi:SHS2 domain-containing protein|nr:archease [Candidatus Nanoarchaeia archaeon]|tara:strand:- start:43946 stop:44371 length:426 start_codon:yes stop_codon:yes gene_type:complete